MTQHTKWVAGVANALMRVLMACGAGLAGGAFVWRAWEGNPGNDAALTVMHGLTGFVLLLAAIHVAFRGFSDRIATQELQS